MWLPLDSSMEQAALEVCTGLPTFCGPLWTVYPALCQIGGQNCLSGWTLCQALLLCLLWAVLRVCCPGCFSTHLLPTPALAGIRDSCPAPFSICATGQFLNFWSGEEPKAVLCTVPCHDGHSLVDRLCYLSVCTGVRTVNSQIFSCNLKIASLGDVWQMRRRN